MMKRLPPPIIHQPKPVFHSLLNAHSALPGYADSPERAPPPPLLPPPDLPATPPPHLVDLQENGGGAEQPHHPDDVAGQHIHENRVLVLGWHADDTTNEKSSDQAAEESSSAHQQDQNASTDDDAGGPDLAGLRGALKDSIRNAPKLNGPLFDFVYGDHDSFEAEVNEFFHYQDNPVIQEGRLLFHDNFKGDWRTSPLAMKRTYIVTLLDELELKNPEQRYSAAKRLLYISQGVFGVCTSVAEQIEWMRSNSKLLLDLDAFAAFQKALKLVSSTLDFITMTNPSLEIQDPTSPVVAERMAAMDLAIAETSVYLSLCYLLVEVNVESPVLVDELAGDAETPPFALSLFELVDQLVEGSRKHYPVKKLLLLLWKVLLATIGSSKLLAIIKNEGRLLENLPPEPKDLYVKSRPQDFHTFNVYVTNKYPAYYTPDVTAISPPNLPLVEPLSQLARRNLNQILSAGPVMQPFALSESDDPVDYANPEAFLPKSFRETLNSMRENMYISASAIQISRERVRMDKWENEMQGQPEGVVPVNMEDRFDPEREVDAVRYKRIHENPEFRHLRRVSVLYDALVPNMSTHVGMLVRLMYYINLGSASQSPTDGSPGAPGEPTAEPGTQEHKQEMLDKKDLDRHKEVVTKAVSAIILILAKAFKCDNVLKFEYMAQLLVDNNCTILILKMLSTWFQNPAVGGTVGQNGAAPANETSTTAWLTAKDGTKELDFFHFCRSHVTGGTEPRAAEGTLQNIASSHDDHDDEDFMDARSAAHSPDRLDVDTSSTRTSASGVSTANNPSPTDTPPCLDASYKVKGSWRNFFTSINLLRILQKLTKRKMQRILALVQWKSSAVLKRMLKTNHLGLQLYALKILKSQIPYMGRKWKGTNMKIITLIYLHLRPYLMEEYLGGDLEPDNDEAMGSEQYLRSLVAFYHHVQYPAHFVNGASNDAKGEGEGMPDNLNEKGDARAHHAMTDHDELELLLDLVRRSHEQYHGSQEALNGMMDDPHFMLNLPIGKNHYVAQENLFNLNEDFMQNYEVWLHQEVFSSQDLNVQAVEDDDSDEVQEAEEEHRRQSLSPAFDPVRLGEHDDAGLEGFDLDYRASKFGSVSSSSTSLLTGTRRHRSDISPSPSLSRSITNMYEAHYIDPTPGVPASSPILRPMSPDTNAMENGSNVGDEEHEITKRLAVGLSEFDEPAVMVNKSPSPIFTGHTYEGTYGTSPTSRSPLRFGPRRSTSSQRRSGTPTNE